MGLFWNIFDLRLWQGYCTKHFEGSQKVHQMHFQLSTIPSHIMITLVVPGNKERPEHVQATGIESFT